MQEKLIQENLDAIIVGGGVAGLACALELIHENNRRFLLLDSENELGGQLKLIIFKIRDFGIYFESGPTLQKQMVSLADDVSVPYRLNTKALTFDLKNKSIETKNGTLGAKTIVLATGSRIRELEATIAPGLTNKIYYWREGNEDYFVGKTVAVYGGGDYACMEAVALAERNPKVILICRSNKLRARPDVAQSVLKSKNIKVIFDRSITSVSGSKSIESLDLANASSTLSESVNVDALLVKIGNRPNSEQFAQELETDHAGFLRVNRQMETSVPGIFAIGDLADGRWLRLASAQGEGVAAAHSVLKYLKQEPD